jgi:hypothetical protein
MVLLLLERKKQNWDKVENQLLFNMFVLGVGRNVSE